eukprot:scaffold1253_cov430-Prasinococcus_capsulatus_cf.AAC.8
MPPKELRWASHVPLVSPSLPRIGPVAIHWPTALKYTSWQDLDSRPLPFLTLSEALRRPPLWLHGCS